MPSSYGRAIAAAVFLFALTVSPYAHADTNVTPIGDPYTDTLQLWSNIIATVEALANDLAISLTSNQSQTASTNGQHLPSPTAQSAAAALATPSNSDSATPTANQKPSATSSEPATNATSDQTTNSSNVKSAYSEPSGSQNVATAILSDPPTEFNATASNFITQDELTAQLQQLSNALTAKFSAPTASFVPQYVAAGGNNENPFAATNAINNLSNVTITNANLTASEIPALNYLSLGGGSVSGLSTFSSGVLSLASSTVGDGTQAGGLTISGGATTTGNAYFAGNIGIGTENPQSRLDIEFNGGGGIFLESFRNSALGGSIELLHARGTQSAPTSLNVGDQGGNLYLDGIDSNNTDQILGDIYSSYNGNIGSKAFGSLNFGVDSTPDDEMIIAGSPTASPAISMFYGSVTNNAISPTLEVNGRVGVGTTTPWAALSVAPGGSANLPAATTTPQFVVWESGSSTPAFIVSGTNNNGNVGVGTTTPSGNLVINGTTGQNLLQIATSTNQGILTVNQNGYVGIGNTAPQAILDIDSNHDFQFLPAYTYDTAGGSMAGSSYGAISTKYGGLYMGYR